LKFQISLNYEGFEKISNKLSKGRVRIFYKGKSSKNTFITEEVAQQMIASLPYTPIKCEYSYDKGDFEGHAKDVIKEIIIGIVPESPNTTLEKVIENDIEREYYTCDVYMFTGIYPEIASQAYNKSQSLEIDETTFDGDWEIIDNEILFVFSKAEFKALQVLGDDRTPAYKSSLFYEELLYELNKTKEEDNIINTEEEKMSVEKELASLQVKLAQYEADTIKNLAKLEIQEGKITQYESEIELLKSSISNYEAQVAEYTTKITEYIVRETEYVDKFTNYESKISEYESKISDYESKISKYEADLAATEVMKTEYESLKSTIEQEKIQYEATKKEAVLNEFKTILGDEKVAELTADKLSYSADDLEKELSAYSFKASKAGATKMFPKPDLGATRDPLAEVLSKYNK
jgi:hypothetical protein